MTLVTASRAKKGERSKPRGRDGSAAKAASATKPAPRLAADAPKVVRIPIRELAPGPWNARHGDVDVTSLAESIRAQGQLDPIQVRQRERPGKGGSYHIIAGERRWRACQKLELEFVDAIVRDVTPAEAAAICYTENAEREDLPPLAEAEAVHQVVKEAGSIELAAEVLGRSPGWVGTRAHVAANLSKTWRDQVTGGHVQWGLAQLALIARLDANDQRELLQSREVTCAKTAKALEKSIDKVVARRISSAGWRADYAGGLKGAPICGNCPKRTSQQRALFEDVEDDRCLDGACWSARRRAWALAVIEEAKDLDDKTVVVKPSGYYDRGSKEWWSEKDTGAKVVSSYDVTPAKKGDKGAVPAVIVHEGDRVTRGWVRPPAKRSSSSSSKPEISREDLLRARRRSALAGEVQAAIADYDPVANLTLEQLIALVATFGTWGRADSLWGYDGYGFPFREPKLDVGKRAGTSLSVGDFDDEDLEEEDVDDDTEFDEVGNLDPNEDGRSKKVWDLAAERCLLVAPDDQKRALWQSLRAVLFDRARWRGSNSHESTAAELERVSAFLKLDVAAMRARVEAAIAIPKTWPEKARAGFTW